MKYVPPLGGGADDAYVNGNPAIGQRGSVVSAEAIEHPMREIMNVIEGAGLNPSSTNLAQLLAAIQALIQAATGGGDTSDFVTMALARSRLPIYPEILTADGKINVTSPGAGTILVPPAVSFVHRGIKVIPTSDYLEAERTFATLANRIYHLRWRPEPADFALLDLSDGAYNPDGLAETHPSFDSTYDDMLVARVVTNGGNVATITNLVNLPHLKSADIIAPAFTQDGTTATFNITGGNVITRDWGRTPVSQASWQRSLINEGSGAYTGGLDWDRTLENVTTRYASTINGVHDGREGAPTAPTVSVIAIG